MLRAGLISALVLAAPTSVFVDSASACVRSFDPALAQFVVDDSLRASDSEPPSPIVDATGFITRRSDAICSGGECTVSTCGPSASLEVEYVRDGVDEELGYRVELVSGDLPPSMVALVGPLRPLTPRIVFEMAFDEAPMVDATIAIIVVDRAGNESEPSEPIRAVWSGCTLPLVGERCLQAESHGCSVSRSTVAASNALLGIVASAGLLLLRRRRRVSASVDA